MKALNRFARFALVVVFVAIVAVWACAVYRVNAVATVVPTKTLEMGESIDLGTNYIDSEYYLAPGYSMKIKDAQVMTAMQFLEESGASSKAIADSKVVESKSPDVLVLTLEVTNSNDRSDGDSKKGYSNTGVHLFTYVIVGDDKSADYRLDTELMELAHPDWQDVGGFAIVNGSTFEIKVPFSLEGSPAYLEKYDLIYREPVEGTEFVMFAADAPERVLMKIIVEE